MAFDTVGVAITLGCPDLDPLMRNLRGLCSLVYDAKDDTGRGVNVGTDTAGALEKMTLEWFERMTPLEQALALLGGAGKARGDVTPVSLKSFPLEFLKLVVPLFEAHSVREPPRGDGDSDRSEGGSSTVGDVLVHLSAHSLVRTQAVLSSALCSKILPAHEVVSVAVSCCYNCDATDEMDVALRICDDVQSNPDTNVSDRARLATLRGDVGVAAVLVRHGTMAVPLARIHQVRSSPAGGTEFVQDFVRKAARNISPSDTKAWDRFLADILVLQRAFASDGGVTEQAARRLHVDAMLKTGATSLIASAVPALEALRAGAGSRREGHAVVHDVTLAATREYINAATGPHDPVLALARACIKLYGALTEEEEADEEGKDSQEEDLEDLGRGGDDMDAELTLLEALQVLSAEFGIDVVPLTLRLSTDRMSFVRRALREHAQGYTKLEEALHLAGCLGYNIDGDDLEPVWAVQVIAARAAIDVGDYNFAYKHCMELLEHDYEPAFEVARTVATKKAYANLNARARLFSQLLALSPVAELEALLGQWKDLDLRRACPGIVTASHVHLQRLL